MQAIYQRNQNCTFAAVPVSWGKIYNKVDIFWKLKKHLIWNHSSLLSKRASRQTLKYFFCTRQKKIPEEASLVYWMGVYWDRFKNILAQLMDHDLSVSVKSRFFFFFKK